MAGLVIEQSGGCRLFFKVAAEVVNGTCSQACKEFLFFFLDTLPLKWACPVRKMETDTAVLIYFALTDRQLIFKLTFLQLSSWSHWLRSMTQKVLSQGTSIFPKEQSTHIYFSTSFL